MILQIDKPREYNEHDEKLVRLALMGQRHFTRSIKSTRIYVEDLEKRIIEDKSGQPHEAWVKTKRIERYYASHEARKNWGYLYRACRRLEACGILNSFSLRYNGDLDVEWFMGYTRKIPNPSPVKSIDPPLQASTIGVAEIMMDTRREYENGEFYHKEDTTISVPIEHRELKAEPRVIVEYRAKKDHKYLHSEEARVERIQNRKAKDIPEYLKNLNSRIKYSGDKGINQDVVHRDPTPLAEKLKRIHEAKVQQLQTIQKKVRRKRG